MNKDWLAWCAGIFEGEGHARVQIIDNHAYAHIEIKINSGKLSEAQKEFERLIRGVKLIKFKVVHNKMVGWQS